MRLVAIGSLAVLGLGACSGSSSGSGFGGGGGGGSDNDASIFGGGDGGTFGGGGGGGGGGGNNGCTAAAELVYVLSVENDLYSFDPPSKAFTKIGPLTCSTAMTPNSMAVDRSATAWVNYVASDPITGLDSAGAIYKVDTSNAHCSANPTMMLPDGWYRIGMGFSTDSASTTNETLYVAGTGSASPFGGNPSQGLGKIDPSGTTLTPIGGFGGALAGQNAELTGTGDGRLFGFFTTTPVQVAQIDKTSGAAQMSQPLSQVETPSFWAFSFWGGDFYLYTAPDATMFPNRTTNVSHYSPSSGAVDPAYMTNIGFRIVGAGVSTCAPVTPPK